MGLAKAPKSAVRRVGVGVDTLALFSTKPLDGAACSKLQELKEAAGRLAEGERGPEIVLGGVGLIVKPYGLKKGPLLAESDLFALCITPRAAEPWPTVTVEIRALALWSLGYEAAAAKACAILADVTREPPDPQVSRVDLTVDFQGWIPAPPDLSDRRRFVCRPRARSRYWEEGDDNKDYSEFDEGRIFTGFGFGRGGVIVARLYDKTREAKKSRKEWFGRVWEKSAGYVADAPVWRLEFQLRRNALREFCFGDTYSERADLGSWEKLRARLTDVWSYLTRRWLRYDEGRTAKERQRLTPEWADLAEARFHSAAVEALHRRKLENQGNPILAALAGYLASGVAQRWALGDDREVGELVKQLVDDAAEYTGNNGRTIEGVAEERAAGFASTARVLALKKKKHFEEVEALEAGTLRLTPTASTAVLH